MAEHKSGPTASHVDFNFGATTDDAKLVGAARPGAKRQRCFDECVKEPVPKEEVDEWVSFVKSQGVEAVVSLLSDDEVEKTYEAPGVEEQMRAAFGDNYHRFDLKGASSPADVLAAVESNVKAGHKTVVHCWGGGGRTGLVQAAWLARSAGLSATEAADAVMAHAKKLGVPRRVDVAALDDFLSAAGAK